MKQSPTILRGHRQEVERNADRKSAIHSLMVSIRNCALWGQVCCTYSCSMLRRHRSGAPSVRALCVQAFAGEVRKGTGKEMSSSTANEKHLGDVPRPAQVALDRKLIARERLFLGEHDVLLPPQCAALHHRARDVNVSLFMPQSASLVYVQRESMRNHTSLTQLNDILPCRSSVGAGWSSADAMPLGRQLPPRPGTSASDPDKARWARGKMHVEQQVRPRYLASVLRGTTSFLCRSGRYVGMCTMRTAPTCTYVVHLLCEQSTGTCHPIRPANQLKPAILRGFSLQRHASAAAHRHCATSWSRQGTSLVEFPSL